MYRAVVAAADELMLCPDLDTLFRRAVELAREKLGVERCAIFVEENGWARGTYGTDLAGHTTDERAFRKPLEEHYGRQVPPSPPKGPSWFVLDHPRVEWDGKVHRQIGEGWTVLTPIRFSDRPIGVFYKVEKPTYESNLPQIKDKPMVKQKLEVDLSEAYKEME